MTGTKAYGMSAATKHSVSCVLGALLISLTTCGAFAAPPVPPPGSTTSPTTPTPTTPGPALSPAAVPGPSPLSPTQPSKDPSAQPPTTASPTTAPPSDTLSSDKPEQDGEPAPSGDESLTEPGESEAAGKPSEPAADGKPAATSEPSKEARAPLDPNAQSPAPVTLVDEPRPKARALEIGSFVGAANRPSEGDLITYGPSVAWGFYGRIVLKKWLGLRLYYREESVPVTVERGGFGSFGATEFDQPNLRLRSLGARIEPTWVPAPRLQVMAVIGISWLRFVAPGATSEGQYDLRTADRSAVELDFQGGVGAAFELVPDWLTIGAQFAYGIASQRTGTAYENVQAFSGGKRYTMGPLPKFDGVTDLLFNVGLIL